MFLTSKIYGPRASHTCGLWILIYIDIIMRIFMKKSHTKISINRARMITTQGDHASLVGILSFVLFLS